MTKAVFTIVSKNYLHYARTLMDSVRVAHPEWKQYVLIVDEIDQDFDPANEAFEVVEVATLPLPDKRAFFFRYTILELNTAVKPWMFEWLLQEQGVDQVVYLDPDIYVYRRLNEVETALQSGALMVLTPHLTGRLDDDHRPHELDIVKAGSFNLGFLAIAKHVGVFEFLAWWKSKLEFNCVVEHENGLFVDQKWLDLAPGMFEGVFILRHEGYNVAYWNLAHRQVSQRDEQYCVNGQPLVFFHFSGLDPRPPQSLSKYQDRFSWSDLGAVRNLVLAYCDRVIANGLATTSRYEYAFGRFTSGVAIPDCIRQLYRHDKEYQRSAADNPFVLTTRYLNQPHDTLRNEACPVTVLMRHVWDLRPDVQKAYPRIFQEDRKRFAEWFVKNGAAEMGIPDECVAPVRAYLSAAGQDGNHGAGSQLEGQQSRSPALDELLRVDDAEFVMRAYRTILQRPADASGLEHYLSLLHRGESKIAILGRLRYSREGRRIKATVGGLPLRYAAVRLLNVVFGRIGGARTQTPRVTPRAGPPTPAIHARRQADTNYISAHRDWPRIARERFGRADYIGFYDWGDQHSGMPWIGKCASVRLPAYEPGLVRIVGSYDATHQRQANGTRETRFDVAVNERSVGEFVLADSGKFDVSISLPEGLFDSPVFLTLTAQHTFVPAAIGLNNDPRELSARIARIALNGQAVVDFGNADAAYVVAPTSVMERGGINIVGYIRSEHGIGESARLCASAALAAALPFSLYDFNAGNAARTEDHTWRAHIAADNPHPVNVFHINADQMTLARETLKEEFFRERYNVGFWHWELPDFPDRFASGFAFLDEIWVPTQFVLDAVSSKSPIPVVRMPHPIRFGVDETISRQQMGLPEKKFLFLSMYDMHSAQGRKNPQAVIAAFRRAFPIPQDVGLVIKVQNTKSCPVEFDELKSELADVPGVVLIDRTLSRPEIYALEALCDSFVSLHRSEGFGLGLAECMYLGKPVIGTNWSGNVDFMNPQNSCPVDYQLIKLEQDYGTYYKKGNTWADPDVDHAAWYMETLVKEPTWRELIAVSGQETIRIHFSPEKVGSLYQKRLKLVARW